MDRQCVSRCWQIQAAFAVFRAAQEQLLQPAAEGDDFFEKALEQHPKQDLFEQGRRDDRRQQQHQEERAVGRLLEHLHERMMARPVADQDRLQEIHGRREHRKRDQPQAHVGRERGPRPAEVGQPRPRAKRDQRQPDDEDAERDGHDRQHLDLTLGERQRLFGLVERPAQRPAGGQDRAARQEIDRDHGQQVKKCPGDAPPRRPGHERHTGRQFQQRQAPKDHAGRDRGGKDNRPQEGHASASRQRENSGGSHKVLPPRIERRA